MFVKIIGYRLTFNHTKIFKVFVASNKLLSVEFETATSPCLWNRILTLYGRGTSIVYFHYNLNLSDFNY